MNRAQDGHAQTHTKRVNDVVCGVALHVYAFWHIQYGQRIGELLVLATPSTASVKLWWLILSSDCAPSCLFRESRCLLDVLATAASRLRRVSPRTNTSVARMEGAERSDGNRRRCNARDAGRVPGSMPSTARSRAAVPGSRSLPCLSLTSSRRRSARRGGRSEQHLWEVRLRSLLWCATLVLVFQLSSLT